MYVSIQYLRAIAVLSVLVLHTQGVFGEHLIKIPLLSEYGWLGVSLFFAISGFVIAETIVRTPNLHTHLYRRYIRVFPLYFLVCFGALVAAMNIGHNPFALSQTDSGASGFATSLSYVAKSLFIIPQDPWPLYAVGWSLEFEIIFYVIFGCAYFALGPTAARLIVLGLAMVGLSNAVGFNHFAHPAMFYFLCGVLVHDLYVHAAQASLRLAHVLVVPTTALWLTQILNEYPLGYSLFVIASAVSFAAIIRIGLSLEDRLKGDGLFALIGNASYSIYLIHWIPVRIVDRLDLDFGSFGNEVARLAFLLFCMWISVIVYRYVETPLVRFFKELPGHVPFRKTA
ncbi:MAG: acyltransferase [Pseudomonadota bacterium]